MVNNFKLIVSQNCIEKFGFDLYLTLVSILCCSLIVVWTCHLLEKFFPNQLYNKWRLNCIYGYYSDLVDKFHTSYCFCAAANLPALSALRNMVIKSSLI